jgi:hypothetical protein
VVWVWWVYFERMLVAISERDRDVHGVWDKGTVYDIKESRTDSGSDFGGDEYIFVISWWIILRPWLAFWRMRAKAFSRASLLITESTLVYI